MGNLTESCFFLMRNVLNSIGKRPWKTFQYERPDDAAPFWKRNPFGQFSATLFDQVYFNDQFMKATGGVSLNPSERSINPYYSEQFCYYLKV
jgi:hypothetical protein